jgi:hypothetical protein
MAIARYRTGYLWEPLVPEKDGEWVKWDDHEAEVAEQASTISDQRVLLDAVDLALADLRRAWSERRNTENEGLRAENAELLRTRVPGEQYQVLIAENERLKAENERLAAIGDW